jgi:hypothetical protein
MERTALVLERATFHSASTSPPLAPQVHTCPCFYLTHDAPQLGDSLSAKEFLPTVLLL